MQDTFEAAIEQRASDIHFEPGAEALRIRLRIDGTLQSRPLLPLSCAAQISARLKVMANLDIAEKRLPQDGQLDYQHNQRQVSFRLSTLPCRYGEKLVLRLLHPVQQGMDIAALGMPEPEVAQLHAALSAPQGLILVTGPTGSGKTQTLYSALTLLNQSERNVCTVEDPIEMPLAGLNQTQLHPKAGLTYQTILRALLRQDPDVIMLGEIRDNETAGIALKAALTGHLVLSTLHTHSTPGTLTRLAQMQIPPWMLATSLNLIIAQRLVKKLCIFCKQPAGHPLNLAPHHWPRALNHWQPVGCTHCFAGYFERTGLFELLPLTTSIRRLIVEGKSEETIESAARQAGMKTLFENGCLAVEQGLTSMAEVYRVLGRPHDSPV